MSRLPLLVAFLWTFHAHAGAPAPCEGSEHTSCENGYVVTHCCPKNAKCNYRDAPFLNCGEYRCVEGKDEGRCPKPEAQVTGASSEDACKKDYGSWQEACVGRKVTKACIAPVPTNYSGPSRNPSFQTCRSGRCTTGRFLEDCHPAKGEIGDKECLGLWTKVCLGGKVGERCLPFNVSIKKELFQATTYTVCGDGSCVVGAEKASCP